MNGYAEYPNRCLNLSFKNWDLYMNKIFTNILRLIVALFFFTTGLACLFLIYLFLYINLEEKLPFHITEDVIAVNDIFSTMYLIKTNDGYIAIDAGLNETVIKKGLKYYGIDPQAIKTLLLTHSDYDHRGGLNIFNNTKIYLSFDEFQMVSHKKQRFNFIPLLPNYFPSIKVNLVKDKDDFSFANRHIRCIALPGHTSGSMGYIIDEKYLFSGDAFRIKNGKISMPYNKWFVMDVDLMKKSMAKVAALKGIKYIFSGNSGFSANFSFAVSGCLN